MKERKYPERTCVVCRNKFDKRDLNRIVRNKDGDIFFDPTGKANGRGSYICTNPDCIDNFFTQKSLGRIFKTNFSPSDIENLKSSILEDLKKSDSEDMS